MAGPYGSQKMSDIQKIVLAYSGGLDTSAIALWLQEEYDCEVIAFTADLGQGEEIEEARNRAHQAGIEKIYIEDLREEFVRDYVFPMLRSNAIYEGEYLLGTAIARPLITKRLVELARESKAEAIAHGATGKGNDQIRFELGAAALAPELRVIAPWREWSYGSRADLVAFCRKRGMEFSDKGSLYSMDANLFHISYEGYELENPAKPPDGAMWQRTVSPQQAADRIIEIDIEFERGDPCGLNGTRMSPAELLTELNRLGGENGIGRVDIVENRYIGMKSRGCYETPGGTILLRAHRAMESLTLDAKLAHLKDSIMPTYAELIYNGYWWAGERQALQQLIDYSQQNVTGRVQVQLYKGNVTIVGRHSPHSLYDEKTATFEDGGGSYDHKDAAGFIRLNALRFLHQKRA